MRFRPPASSSNAGRDSGAKREMLVGRFVPRGRVRAAFASEQTTPDPMSDKHALVIGAGLAGCAVAERLAARGWRVDLVERDSAAASGASGLRAAVFQPHASRDDCLLSRWTRAAFLHANAQWPRLLDDAQSSPWQRCGVMQLADGAANEERVADTAARLGYPGDYARYVSRDDACGVVGADVAVGGWWFAHAGHVAPGRDRGAAAGAVGPARWSRTCAARSRRSIASMRNGKRAIATAR